MGREVEEGEEDNRGSSRGGEEKEGGCRGREG